MNRKSTHSGRDQHSGPADFRAKPNRRVNGQRRIQQDRRKADIHVENCRRRQSQDRRNRHDRRPEQTFENETLICVPARKKFVTLNQSRPVGQFINISV